MLSASVKDQIIGSIASSFGPKDQFEDNLGKTIVGNMVNQSVANAQQTSIHMSTQLVDALAKLKDMGYDENSDIVKNLIANSNAIQATANKVSESMARFVS